MSQRYVPVTIGGEEKLLRFDFNAMADVEGYFGKGIVALLQEEIVFHTLRGLYWAGLKWKDRGLTLERTGQLLSQAIDEGMTIQELSTPVIRAIELAGFFGAKQEEKKGKNSKTA